MPKITLAELKAKPFKFSPEERRQIEALTEDEIDRMAEEDDTVSSDEDLERMVGAREVRRIRESTNLSQTAFAERYGFSPGRVRDWEQGRTLPDEAMFNYLRLIRYEPHVVEGVLKKAS